MAPRQLAAADANGLRRYQQQRFVELEGHTDWVVQVEYDASVGAFRAKRRKELWPSGPALYRVAGTAKWSTESTKATVERYLIPDTHRANVALLSGHKRGLIRGYRGPWSNAGTIEANRIFTARQDLLLSEATSFLNQVTLPARPPLDPGLMLATSADQVFALIYSHSKGLVLGEAHAGIGSKQLLIDNMASLVRQGVKTLYLEHLRTDFEQFGLDTYQRTGAMPESLKRYLETQDLGHKTDPSGTYSFLNLVITARAQGVSIRALDCAASYHMNTGYSAAHRMSLMNYYADLVIKADASNLEGGKWIALVGDAHTHDRQGIPGLAALQGVPGIRIADIEGGAPISIAVDRGRGGVSAGHGPFFVKADLVLYTGVPPYSALRKDGDFFIYDHFTHHSLQLVHREGQKTLLSPIVKTQDNHFHLVRSQWQDLHAERFGSLSELTSALINQRGMVAVLPLDRPVVSPTLEPPLMEPGHFFIDTTTGGQLHLKHRSSTGIIVETPITHGTNGFALAIERWPAMKGQAFGTLDELRAALLSRLGMTDVSE
ncbi:membrane-targeted effector domain-containing toxin [Pseudomonas batumici]|uniref:membrane-targeted effector domain-containing toxin n=1 Tax=Pseudomonas batumici TaxID=226910 RepID=UPI001427A586|nr:membrane-targeted effector domain-containing toxin [Pseudomonas batumici]